MSIADLKIDLVSLASTGELLTLQRAAFVGEAIATGDLGIPALSQSFEDLRAELQDEAIVPVGAWIKERLVASVRIRVDGTRADIGRLCVAPDLQGRGISTALLLGAAPLLPDGVTEVWVLTPRDDARAIDAYMENGFEHQFDETTDRITKAQLRKLLVPNE
ncbi:MAG TPA: GNAT family N-acetyltransferase [Actinomycetales bacterium]|nr:GNAT family N-acetyltransferase [Actinomycetales bacterium]